MTSGTALPETIVAERRGRIGSIVLNRPRALNAIDGAMFAGVYDTLLAWRDDPAIEAVVIRGAGTSFSAGGDIRAVRDAVQSGDAAYAAGMYFREYRANALIAAYPKPYVAAIDGYCMGGGLGLAMHGAIRAITSRAVLSMPETGIAFFPDCGASYVLPRLPDRIGWYAGTTAARLTAGDALASALATHLLRDEDFARIEEIVAEDPRPEALAVAFAALSQPSPASELRDKRELVARAFASDRPRAILDALERESDPWAVSALAALRKGSPTSIATTCELFHRGGTLPLDRCLEMEFQLAKITCTSAEFHEGVRAMVIDKDRTPRWRPATLEEMQQSSLAETWKNIDPQLDELELRTDSVRATR